jgi:twinkle protein
VDYKFCPFCRPHKDKFENLWKLSINLENGTFFCIRCNSRGSWISLRKAFQGEGTFSQFCSNFKQSSVTSEERKIPDQKTLTQYQKNLSLQEYVPVLKYLTHNRKLQKRVLDLYGIGAGTWQFGSSKHLCFTFPWIHLDSDSENDGKIIEKVKYRSISEKSCTRIEPVRSPFKGFFGWHTVPISSEEIVITEGEFDAMSVYQETGLPAISLPYGASSFPPEILPSLERFQRIIIWMDDDEPGQSGCEKLVQKLGIARCFIVRSRQGDVMGPKDANDALKQGKDLKSLIAAAKKYTHKDVASFDDIKADVLREVLLGKCLAHYSFDFSRSIQDSHCLSQPTKIF